MGWPCPVLFCTGWQNKTHGISARPLIGLCFFHGNSLLGSKFHGRLRRRPCIYKHYNSAVFCFMPESLLCLFQPRNVIFFFLSGWFGKNSRLPFKEGIILFVVITGVLSYGFYRIYEIDRISSTWKNIKVAVIQGNIDQGRKWDESFQGETVEIYRNLSFSISREMPELIVWPETAVPFYLQSDKNLSSLIFDVPKKTGTHLFTGSPAYKGYGEDAEYYNSAFLISPDGEFAGRYDKIP